MEKNKDWIVSLMIVILLLTASVLLLLRANKEQDRLLFIGDCVGSSVIRDRFNGTSEEAWTIYALNCKEQY